MELHLVRDFGTGDIETIEISPAVLEIEVEPRMAGEADRILMVHSVPGRFAYITGPYPGRFGEALLEIAELSGGSPPPYAVRDLYRRREETIVRKETDTIEDEIALGLYDDEDL